MPRNRMNRPDEAIPVVELLTALAAIGDTLGWATILSHVGRETIAGLEIATQRHSARLAEVGYGVLADGQVRTYGELKRVYLAMLKAGVEILEERV
jgi:hypothetical protein